MFDITFLGASGGPFEQGTCSVLLKPHSKSFNELITRNTLQQELLLVDAGSGLAQLTDIIHQEQKYKRPHCRALQYYDDAVDISLYVNTKLITPFSELKLNAFQAAQRILSLTSNCLITHPHLDHVTALVVNLPFYQDSVDAKNIYGSQYTINALQEHLFNGIIWPSLPQLQFNTIGFETKKKMPNSKYDVIMFPLSHGRVTNGESVSNYLSSAFLISYEPSTEEEETTVAGAIEIIASDTAGTTESNASILIFGDFESDKISTLDYNIRIWKHIAPLILSGQLKTIVLECSNGNRIQQDELYGHLNPSHLISELIRLRAECLILQPLAKQPLLLVNVIITHVKEHISLNEPLREPRRIVLRELEELKRREGLELSFLVALSGVTIVS